MIVNCHANAYNGSRLRSTNCQLRVGTVQPTVVTTVARSTRYDLRTVKVRMYDCIH